MEKDALTIFRTIQKCRHQALHTNDCGNCERCQYYLEHEQIDGAVALAISALEKQTPRTVRTQFDRRHNYFLHFCPVCGGLAREYEYCSECGQKLSYEEDTEDDRDTRM